MFEKRIPIGSTAFLRIESDVNEKLSNKIKQEHEMEYETSHCNDSETIIRSDKQ